VLVEAAGVPVVDARDGERHTAPRRGRDREPVAVATPQSSPARTLSAPADRPATPASRTASDAA
jgi:hypothetical protein